MKQQPQEQSNKCETTISDRESNRNDIFEKKMEVLLQTFKIDQLRISQQ